MLQIVQKTSGPINPRILTVAAAFDTAYMMVPFSPVWGTVFPATELTIMILDGSFWLADFSSKGVNLRWSLKELPHFCWILTAIFYSLLCQEKYSSHIQVQDLLTCLIWSILKRASPSRTSIGDKNIQLFFFLLDPFCQTHYLSFVRDIGWDTHSLPLDAWETVEILDRLIDALGTFCFSSSDYDLLCTSKKESRRSVEA